MSLKSKFKNSNGTYVTKALFWEQELEPREFSLYTLKDYDHTVDGVVYPSLRRLFVEEEDPTEYSFACRYLDGWNHWKRMTSQVWFQEYLAEWREELEIRIRSKALARIKTIAESKGKESFAADKLLSGAGWRTPAEKDTKVGRPTKEKIRHEAELLFAQSAEHDEDFDRIIGTPNGLN